MTQFNNGCAPQADTKTPERVYTREEVLLQREAYAAGLRTAGYLPRVGAKFAAEKYPLPKKIVPREIEASTRRNIYRMNGDVMQVRLAGGGGGWVDTIFSAGDLRKFGELADNPTCEVEVDA